MSGRIELFARPSEAGERLDVFLTSKATGLSRSQARNLIVAGCVRIDGKPPVKPGQPLKGGERIVVEIPDPRRLDLTPADVGIRILFEDANLAVLEKPAGVSVHPSTTETGPTVVHGLLAALANLSSVGGVERPGIVHRIDKGTSGILVVSKTDAAHAGLAAQFKTHTIERAYKALVHGDLAAKGRVSGAIETFYGRNPRNRKKMTGKLSSGRRAVTHWRVLENLGALTLLECRLETGRTHQIRVHLSELGFPVVGDPLYGDNDRRARFLQKNNPALSRACLDLDHQLLHAFRLGFTHPVTGEKLSFESELPEEFRSILALATKWSLRDRAPKSRR
ncbi:MAG: RluA family pseudouridine synthase [Deltaproteobacteria bacterium]|nr:RluA family pseudouridine synthase [Deltaproteobacteria bacterium]